MLEPDPDEETFETVQGPGPHVKVIQFKAETGGGATGLDRKHRLCAPYSPKLSEEDLDRLRTHAWNASEFPRNLV